MNTTDQVAAQTKPRFEIAYDRLAHHETNCNRCHRGVACRRGAELLQAANSAVRDDRRHGSF